MPFDEVYIHKSPAYTEQQNVEIDGEVAFTGTYTLTRRNARLTDLLNMAGGATKLAYIPGARLERKTNEAERKRMEAAMKMAREQQQQQLLELASSSNNASAMTQLGQQANNTQLEKFNIPEYYSVGIELDEALKHPESDANIVLREGDRLYIPKYNATVKVNGAVLYPNTVAYERGKSPRYYINAAGGFSQKAKKSNAYIIYMNGMVAKVSNGAKVRPGCEIVVPSKLTRRTSVAEMATMGTSIASIATMIATIANMSK